MEECNKVGGCCQGTEFRDVRSADQKNKLEESDIEKVIVSEKYYTIGEKTTACVLTLINSYEVTGLSACVDPKNYNQEVGAPFAKRKAMDQVWALEAYLLQQQLAEINSAASYGAMLMDPQLSGEKVEEKLEEKAIEEACEESEPDAPQAA